MKKGNIMRDVISSSQFTANVIKEYKKGLGYYFSILNVLVLRRLKEQNKELRYRWY